MNLSDLKIGEKGIIQHILREDVFLKLLDMGCVPGEVVEILFLAPLGDPLAILVSGYTISIRKAEAKIIEVKKIEID